MGDQVKKLKRSLLVIIVLIAGFAAYVEIANRNSKNMTYRQKILKAIYPVIMLWGKISGRGTTALSNQSKQAPVPFYTLKAKLNNGDTLDFASLKGKKVMLVNTASDCGYSNQYNQLQELSVQYKDKLVLLGFPANDFKEEEKGTDQEIAAFCKLNYGVSFPLMSKSVVIRSDQQNPVYQWLTDASRNGWNSKQPGWNFCKYIVDEKGMLTHYFGSSVSPLSKEIKKAIE